MKQRIRFFCLTLLVMVAGMAMAQTYTVAGVRAIVKGDAEWDATNAANDMTSVGGNYYKLVVEDCELVAKQSYKYKVCVDHEWSDSYGNGVDNDNNSELIVGKSGTYTITFIFDKGSKKTTAITSASVAGSTNGSGEGGETDILFGKTWDTTSNDMTLQDDGTYKLTKNGVSLKQGTVAFKIALNHLWNESYPANNYELSIPEDGTYNCEFTFNPYSKEVKATANECVAQIGDTYYETLQAAFNAATGGETITLLENINLTEGVTNTGNAVLDLNGKDITGSVNGKLITNSGTLTIQGIGNIYNQDISAQGHDAIYNTGSLTINGGVYGDADDDQNNANALNRGAAIRNYGGTVTINSGSFTACDNFTNGGFAYALINDNGGTMTINGATVYGKNNGNIANNYGTVTIKDGTYTLNNAGSYYSLYIDGEDGIAKTIVEGGTFSNTSNNGLLHTDDANNASLEISGGSFTYTKLTNKDASNVAVSGGTFSSAIPEAFCAEGYIPTELGNGQYGVTQVSYVAQIGTQKYTTLQAAFNAANDGDVVTLLEDYDATGETMAGGTRQFVINKSITFDGGGHTLTTKQRGIGIGNVNKDLNDKDNINVTIKNVTVLNTSDGARCIDTRGKIGSLTLNGVNLNTQGATGTTQPLTIGGNQSDAATVTITNSTIQTNDEATAYYAIMTYNPVEMTVTNSTIKGWANIYAKGQDNSAGSAGSVFNLDNCTLLSSNDYSGTSNAFGAFMVEDNNVTINVTNSEMTLNNSGDQIQAIALYPYQNALTGNKVTLGEGNEVSFVEPGKFAFVANLEAAKFTITGGTFNVDPTPYLAEGYKAVENNGTWTVQVKTVARIGSVEYTTLESAAEAAKSGETIVLLEDIDLSNHARSASDDIILTGVTLDLNGKTVRGFNSGVRYSGTGAVIKNGTFDFVEAEAKPNYGLSIGSYNSKNHDTGFTLQDLTVKGGINIDYADVTLNDVDIDMGASTYYAIWVDEDGASATYNSGAITASTSATAVFGVAKGLNGAADGSIKVTGGKILTNGKNLRLVGNYLPVEVSGGVFDAAVPEDCCAEGYIPTANTDEETKATYPYTVKQGAWVARIGTTGYETLADAIEAATDGANTITLLADIDLGENAANISKAVTIEGDGHTVASTATQAIAISGSGNVTINNTVVSAKNRGINVLNVSTGFTLNVNNSIIQSQVDDPTTTYTIGENSRGINVANADGVTVNITNSTIQGFSYDINIPTSGKNLTVNVTGGKTNGRAIVNNWGSNNTFNLNGVEVHGLNNEIGPQEAFACIVENKDCQNNNYIIQDCQFIATLSEAAMTTSGSSATEHMMVLRGTNATLKVLGSTTYTCNSDERGGFITNEGELFANKLYFDDTTKATFANAFKEAVIADEKDAEVGLYPVTYTTEVYYYWIADGAEQGVYTNLATPFTEGWLDDGEFIRLNKNIELTANLTWAKENASFTMTFGDYKVTKGEYSIALKQGVTVNTDKQTDIFSAVDEGYKVVETAVEGGYTYTVVAKEYIAQIGEGESATKYETLQDAINACKAGTETTIKLLDNVTDGAGFAIPDGVTNKNIIIDFDGKSYNVTKDAVGSGNTKSQAMHFYSGNTLTLKNGTITSAATSEENKLKMMMQNYCDLTLDGMTINCSNVNGGTYGTFTGADAYWSNKSVPVFNFNTGNATIKNTTITFRDGDNMGLCVDGGTVALGEGVVVNGPVSAVTGTVTITDGKYSGAITADKATIQISGGVFAEKPAEEYCADGYVATDNTDEATMAQYPYTVKSKEEAGVFELIDGKVYPYLDYNEDKPAESVSYFRTFKNQNWQSLYIPFDINDVTKLADKYEFAKVHMVAYETDDNGVVSSDRIRLYYIPITSGTIYANKPYLIKLKNKEDMNKQQEIKVEKTTLYKTQNINDDPMKCSTTNADYLFKGTYRTDEVKAVPNDPSTHFFGVGGGGISYISNNTLSSYRWYIKVDPKDVNYAKPTIEFVMGDEGVTGISNIDSGDKSEIDGYYTINGVRSEVPVRGMNIVKYKNGKTKKVMIK